MIALVQRVTSASVSIENKIISKIGIGLVVLLGIKNDDTNNDIEYIIKKLLKSSFFSKDNNRFDMNIADNNGEILVVSQFTLYGDYKKGTGPSFTYAMSPDNAKNVYNEFIAKLESKFEKPIKTGEFGKYMKVELTNDGPVTFILNSDHFKNANPAKTN